MSSAELQQPLTPNPAPCDRCPASRQLGSAACHLRCCGDHAGWQCKLHDARDSPSEGWRGALLRWDGYGRGELVLGKQEAGFGSSGFCECSTRLQTQWLNPTSVYDLAACGSQVCLDQNCLQGHLIFWRLQGRESLWVGFCFKLPFPSLQATCVAWLLAPSSSVHASHGESFPRPLAVTLVVLNHLKDSPAAWGYLCNPARFLFCALRPANCIPAVPLIALCPGTHHTHGL